MVKAVVTNDSCQSEAYTATRVTVNMGDFSARLKRKRKFLQEDSLHMASRFFQIPGIEGGGKCLLALLPVGVHDCEILRQKVTNA